MGVKIMLIVLSAWMAAPSALTDPETFQDRANATQDPFSVFSDYFSKCDQAFPKIYTDGKMVDKARGFLLYVDYNLVAMNVRKGTHQLPTSYGMVQSAPMASDGNATLQLKLDDRRYALFLMYSVLSYDLQKSGIPYTDSLVDAYDPAIVEWGSGKMLFGFRYGNPTLSLALAVQTNIEPWTAVDSNGRKVFTLKYDSDFSMFSGSNNYPGFYFNLQYRQWDLGFIKGKEGLDQFALGNRFDLTQYSVYPNVRWHDSRKLAGIGGRVSSRGFLQSRMDMEGDIGLYYTWYASGPSILYHFALSPSIVFGRDSTIPRDFTFSLKSEISAGSDIMRESVFGWLLGADFKNLFHVLSLSATLSRNSYSMLKKVPSINELIPAAFINIAW